MRARSIHPQPDQDQRPGQLTAAPQPVISALHTHPNSALRLFQVEVAIRHHSIRRYPHAVIQAWELVSWLTSRLSWTVQAGKVQEGLEIGWQFQAPHGAVRVRIRRLPEGPPEVLTLRLQCLLGGKPGAVLGKGTASGTPAVSSWIKATGLSVPVTAGTKYWLVALPVGSVLGSKSALPVLWCKSLQDRIIGCTGLLYFVFTFDIIVYANINMHNATSFQS